MAELMNRATERNVDPGLAVRAWSGWDSASRDFASQNLAVEAKTTRSPSRNHWVHPIYQLLPADGTTERVYVYSVGISVDQSRPFRLLTMIDRVLAQVTGEDRRLLIDRLGQYCGVGFDESHRGQYELEPGFYTSQRPALIRVDYVNDILRPESFVDGNIPARISDLRYAVTLDGLPAASAEERQQVLDELLQVKP